MVKRPASALDNPVRDSPSSTASQRTKVILNTPANGVSAGEVCCAWRRTSCELYVARPCLVFMLVSCLSVAAFQRMYLSD